MDSPLHLNDFVFLALNDIQVIPSAQQLIGQQSHVEVLTLRGKVTPPVPRRESSVSTVTEPSLTMTEVSLLLETEVTSTLPVMLTSPT